MALPNNFAEGLMSFKQGIKDMKRIFNPTGPGLPEADAAMVADAERLYAEGSISPRSRSGSRTSRLPSPRPVPSPRPRLISPVPFTTSRSDGEHVGLERRDQARARRGAIPPRLGVGALQEARARGAGGGPPASGRAPVVRERSPARQAIHRGGRTLQRRRLPRRAQRVRGVPLARSRVQAGDVAPGSHRRSHRRGRSDRHRGAGRGRRGAGRSSCHAGIVQALTSREARE